MKNAAIAWDDFKISTSKRLDNYIAHTRKEYNFLNWEWVRCSEMLNKAENMWIN